MSNKIISNKGDLKNGLYGGIFKGKRHINGGIPIKTPEGTVAEVEDGEPIIIPSAVNSSKKVSFNGKLMTPKEVVSKINEKAGGVPIKKYGGEVTNKNIKNNYNEDPILVENGSVIITRSAILNETKHEYNGEMLTNKEILSRINHDIGGGVEFAEGGKIESNKMQQGGLLNAIELSKNNLQKNGLVLKSHDKSIIVLAYNTGGQEFNPSLYNLRLIRDVVAKIDNLKSNELVSIFVNQVSLERFDEKKLDEYKKAKFLIICNQNEVIYNSNDNFEDGGNLDCGCNHTMEQGGEIKHEQTYKKWKSLVNMSKGELENFYNSEEGKEAGLSSSKANELGIHSGRESARWIMKMKDTPHQDWTPKMWEWAKRQISFISRMSGNKGGLYDDKGNKTRKHTSLLIWGHNPKKYESGGEIYLPKYGDDSYNIELAKKLVSDLGLELQFIGYSDTNGTSVYFEDKNGLKYRVSDHSVTSKSRMDNEILLSFDERLMGFRGSEPEIKSKYQRNLAVINSFKSGGTISQTPAPKSDKVYGSNVNDKGSSKDIESAKEITFDAKTLLSINEKVREHNRQHPNKKITLASAKAVVRRGMGAYSSTHRPTISGGKPNSRVAWGLARLNAFMYKIINGKSKSGKYKQDDDLINELGYSVKSYEDGGSLELLAPNGKPSNLTPEQYKLVRTPQFKAWFGDWEKDPANSSKVVDENGEPLVVYHGSSEDFNVFKYGEFGFHFGTKSQATDKVKRRIELNWKYSIKQYFLKIKNPLISTDFQEWNWYDMAINYRKNKIINEVEYESIMNLKNGHQEEVFKTILENKNIDGIFYDNLFESSGLSFLCWQPNQIKLADGSNTTFDMNNEDIRYESGGEILKDHNAEFEKLKKDFEFEIGFEIEKKEHKKTLEDLERHTITKEQALGEIVESHLNENPNYYIESGVKISESKKQFKDGGEISAEKKAEEYWNSLSEENKSKILNDFGSAINDLKSKYKQDVIDLETKKSELVERRKAIYEEEKQISLNGGNGVTTMDLFKERQGISFTIKQLDLSILHAKNVEKAFSNDGTIIEFEDKKGVLNTNIPSFLKVDTSVISFNEETILADEMPKYIPYINEETFRIKGFVFDAIRIDKDTYIVAVSGYRETNNDELSYNEIKEGKEKHPTVEKQGYVLVTLDQLVLINDYYITKQKAIYQKEAEEKTKRQEDFYDKLPIAKRESHLNQKGYYNTLPASVKKKVTQSEYEALDLNGKEALYKPFKRYNPERLKSKLEENYMWTSFHKMYERFLDPTATNPKKGIAHPLAFEYWRKFRDMMSFKIKDIKMQREVDNEQYKKALETSFGDVNTNDSLFGKYGILVKRQDGKTIEPTQVNQIEQGWVKIQKSFGNLIDLAKEQGLKISHTNQTNVFASKAIGVFVPKMKTIAVSAKYGNEQFDNTFAHEVAHFIDSYLGTKKGKRWATDDYESTAGVLAFEFRNLLNKKSDSDYINATKECFARALQQYFAISTFGDEAQLTFSENPLNALTYYFLLDNFVSKENYYNIIKPMVETFLTETGFDIFIEEVKQEFLEPKESEIIEQIEPTEKPIEEIRLLEIEKNIQESKNEEAEINAIQDPTKRLSILKESLRKKEELFNQKIQEHFDTVRQANGQPLNDKRNGQATLNKWERQNDAIRNIKESIEKTKNAIQIEEGKIKQVSATKEYLPKQLLDAIDNGTIVQWRKHPNTFFVAGVDKARLVWDNKDKVLAYRYIREVTDKEQYKKFAKTYNELYNAIKNNIELGVKTEEIAKENIEEVTPKNYNIGDEFMLGEDKIYIGENGAFGLNDEVCLYNSKDKSLLKCFGKNTFDIYVKQGKFSPIEKTINTPNEIDEFKSKFVNNFPHYETNTFSVNSLVSFSVRMQHFDRKDVILGKNSSTSIGYKITYINLSNPKNPIKIVENYGTQDEAYERAFELYKVYLENEKQNIEVHKPTEVESIADTKSNKVGRKAKETKSTEPTQKQIRETIDGLMILADMGDADALATVEGLQLLLD